MSWICEKTDRLGLGTTSEEPWATMDGCCLRAGAQAHAAGQDRTTLAGLGRVPRGVVEWWEHSGGIHSQLQRNKKRILLKGHVCIWTRLSHGQTNPAIRVPKSSPCVPSYTRVCCGHANPHLLFYFKSHTDRVCKLRQIQQV